MYTRLRQTSLLFIMRDFILIKKTKLYHHWLKQMSGQYNIYKIKTNDHTAIRKFKEGNKSAVMLAGGPKLVEGELLPNNEEYRIIQISYIQGNYYLILEEINKDDNQESTSSSI